jgi:protein-S-isoprenylcysteine O-methyltransferase Ste14
MDFEKIFRHRIWAALWQLFSRGFILVGLPLLAWGANDLKGFLSNPVRASYTVVVCVQALLHAWITYITPEGNEEEHRFDLARWHAYLFETIFVLAAFGDRRNLLAWNENLTLRWVGLGIYLFGACISVWSNLTWVNHLRREGQRAAPSPVLLTEGLFGMIRHPAMLALIFYCLGVAIAYRSWIGLALMFPLLGGIVNRINNVEKIFGERYAKVWRSRVNTSKRIIPFIY